jgi:hypothetical protein
MRSMSTSDQQILPHRAKGFDPAKTVQVRAASGKIVHLATPTEREYIYPSRDGGPDRRVPWSGWDTACGLKISAPGRPPTGRMCPRCFPETGRRCEAMLIPRFVRVEGSGPARWVEAPTRRCRSLVYDGGRFCHQHR